MSELKISIIQRITTEFDLLEDRFKLNALLNSGSTLTLWLTQRLFLRLLEQCFDWLQKQNIELLESTAEEKVHDRLNEFSQESALNELTQEDPVISAESAPNFVIQELDIKFESDRIILIFKGNNDHYGLVFNCQQLRQWLHIVHKKWVNAEWPLSIWPSWICPSSTKLIDSNDPLH